MLREFVQRLVVNSLQYVSESMTKNTVCQNAADKISTKSLKNVNLNLVTFPDDKNVKLLRPAKWLPVSHDAAFAPMCCNYLTPRRISSNVLYLSHTTQHFLQCVATISRHAEFPPMYCIYLTPRRISSNVLYLSHTTQHFLQCVATISRHAEFPPMYCIYLTPRRISSNVLYLSHATQHFLQCVVSISRHAVFAPMCL